MNLAVFLLPLVPLVAVPEPDADGVARAVDELLSKEASTGKFAGAILVAHGPDIVLEKGYGLANREDGTEFRADAISTIGSITKQFTAAAILSLKDQGKLKTTDTLSAFFDDLPDDKKDITVHQLLTHSAGLTDVLGIDEEYIGRDELMELAWKTPLRHAPGAGYDYSNLGYSILGAIVEKTSGLSYEDYLSETFFEPLGMTETGYWLPDWDFERVPVGYRNDQAWGTVLDKQDPLQGPSWHLRCNGGIHSTLLDMHRWVEALRNGEVLSDESRKELFTQHVPEGGGTFYGYGWSIAPLPSGHRMIGHNGGNGFLGANVDFYPDDGGWFFALFINDTSNFRVVRDIRSVLEREIRPASKS